MTKSIFTFLFFSLALNSSAQYFGWSKTIGGTDADTCVALAIDKQTNLYAIGSFSGYGDFRNDTIIDKITSNGKEDIFLQKRTKKGKYLWTKKIGGKGNDRPSAMIYYNGSLFITGTFEDTLDLGIQKIIPQGKKSIFLAKMDTAGNCLWVKTLGDTLYSRARSLAINKEGIYLSGEFSGKIEKTAYINSMFLQKRDLDGNVTWTKTFGTKRSVISNSITIDSLGNLYNVGSLIGNNVDFDPSPVKDSTLSSTTNGLSDIFIQKLNANGELFWVKKLGNTAADEATTIISKGNEIYVSGYFSLTVDFDPSLTGISNLSSKGGKDIFIGKYDLSGKLLWIKQIGNTKEETAKQLEIDKYKNIYLVGTFNTSSGSSTDFLGKSLSTSGSNDVFCIKFDTQGKGILAKQFSGSGSDYGSSVKADTSQNVYIGGSYGGSLTIAVDVKAYTSNGISDVFIYKSLLYPDANPNTSVFENKLNFKIYPNPVNDQIHLTFDKLTKNTSLILSNVSGQVIFQKELIQDQFDETINTNELSPGIYFLNINSIDTNYSYKIHKL